jgi:hypothetical protein
MIELRCPAEAQHLLGKISPVGTDDNFRVEVACAGCRHALRADRQPVRNVFIMFDGKGNVTNHRIAWQKVTS